jgi:effector-binding domain-containing protein
MSYQIQIQWVDAQPLAVVARQTSVAELSRVVPECCGLVWQFVQAAGLRSAGRHVAMYWNDAMHIEVGVEVNESFASDGDVHSAATPAGTVATVTHMGPYQQLAAAHAALRQWCQDHHRNLAGPSWEIYGHWNDDPAKVRTDIFYLLRDPVSP